MFKTSPLTILEFNSNSIRVCRSILKKRIFSFKDAQPRVVTHCFSFDCDMGRKDLHLEISRQLNTHNIRPENVILSLPRYYAISRFLRLPSKNNEELNKMITMYLLKEGLLVDGARLVYDYQVAGSDKQGYSLVNIFCVRQDTVEEHLSILKKIKILPQRVTLNTQGLLNWSILNDIRHGPEAERCRFILNADSKVFDFVVASGASAVFSRTFTIPFSEFHDFKKWLAREIKISLEMFRRLSAGIFECEAEIFIIGAPSGLREGPTRRIVSCRLDEPNSLDNFSHESFRECHSRGREISYISALGLALGNAGREIDITPVPLRRKSGFYRNMVVFRKIIVLLATMMFCLSFFILKITGIKIDRMRFLSGELKKMSIAERQRVEFIKDSFLENKSQKNGAGLKVLYGLYNLAPESLYVTDLNLTGNGNLTVSGFSKNMKDIFDFFNGLKNTEGFAKVNLDYLDSSEDAKDGDEIVFRIALSLQGYEKDSMD